MEEVKETEVALLHILKKLLVLAHQVESSKVESKRVSHQGSKLELMSLIVQQLSLNLSSI